ncbi:DeoR/GlpR transcriptional regulator, partial [Streptococcus danieliae]|nr:DeoR/GlpR transcriptional regulator [Streptococcus danieliae]
SRKSLVRGMEDSIGAKKKEYYQDKYKVANYVAEHILRDGQTIYLDAGTTTYNLIDKLRNRRISVVTNSVYHLNKLLENKIHTILLGGLVKHSTQAIVGVTASEQLDKYSFDACFI